MIELKIGLPSIIIEADHSDPQFYFEADMDNRLQTFIETLSSNKGT